MPTNIKCPACSRALEIPDELMGKKVKCPACKMIFTATADASSSASGVASAPRAGGQVPKPKSETDTRVRRKPPPPPSEEEEDDLLDRAFTDVLVVALSPSGPLAHILSTALNSGVARHRAALCVSPGVEPTSLTFRGASHHVHQTHRAASHRRVRQWRPPRSLRSS